MKVKYLAPHVMVWYKNLMLGTPDSIDMEKYGNCEVIPVLGNYFDADLIPISEEMRQELEDKILQQVEEEY